jgi:type II secretory ATPase GspE/PulE/Tfp pilus assembly ATPase PilB-like protein
MLKFSVSKTFTDALIKSGLVDEPQLQQYILSAQGAGQRLSVYLLHERILSIDVLLKALSLALHLEIADLKKITVDQSVIERVPVKIASYYHFMPVAIDGNKLTVAVTEPLDIYSHDDIRAHLKFEPKFVLASPWDIDEALKKYYGLASETIDQILTKEPKARVSNKEADRDIQDIHDKGDDPSVTKLVNEILFEAYQKRATDIHIEPYRHKVRFRYRIDGALVDANLPSEARHFLAAILSRIKIMANLSITEKRLPQDGSAVVRVKEQALDLRVSTIPTAYGESMVIRILPATTMLMDLERLGFNKENAKRFRDLIHRPHGVIFLTGPTGSGKTTTLYACLNEINNASRKIITIEDPIEYEMAGITQIQINPAIEFTFAKGLRSILRHDPDILMVGEVRDLETAEIAIRTALTGHLVFSSLHTNDAASGVTRLVDMGVEPYLVASSVQAFVAQRLVRQICPKCKEEDHSSLAEIRQEIAQSLDFASAAEIKLYHGRGCDHCNGTGYYGRTAIYEILEINENVRAVILDKPRAEEIKRVALRQGMRTLRQDGWKNVINGVTTPAEVMNVTLKEDIGRGFDSAVAGGNAPIPASYSKAQQTARYFFDLRAYPRLQKDVAIEFQVMQKDKDQPQSLRPVTEVVRVLTSDISGAGVSFLTDDCLLTGSLVRLRIYIDGDRDPVDFLTKVVRVIKDPVKNKFLVAVFFLDIPPGDRERLIALSRNNN